MKNKIKFIQGINYKEIADNKNIIKFGGLVLKNLKRIGYIILKWHLINSTSKLDRIKERNLFILKDYSLLSLRCCWQWPITKGSLRKERGQSYVL